MLFGNPRRLAALLALVFAGVSFAADKKPATIKILLPDNAKVALKVEGKDLEANEKAKEGQRVLVTPELEPGKTYTYKIEALIEPNNYTKITRTREITFKAGDEITLDIRKKDDVIADDVKIRWVPTPKIVVEDMAKLAEITKDDKVMDPGCGDAVMIITAVQDFKAKAGLGIDYDPKKVEESIVAVKNAKLQDKIFIKQGDALKLTEKDFEGVTVVMLYMGDELNIRLRPALFKYLKPGARVVSHRFIMGDWKPAKTITVTREGDYGVEDFELHLWKITGKEAAGEYEKKK